MGTQRDSEKPAVSRRKFLQGMAGIAGASLLAACGGAAAPTGGGTAPTAAGAAAGGATAAPAAGGAAQATVEWWDSQTGVDEEITKKMIDTFQQKNPDIKINRTYIAQEQGTQANQKLLTAIAGGTPPDVYKFDRFIVAQFAAQDFLTDLTDLSSTPCRTTPTPARSGTTRTSSKRLGSTPRSRHRIPLSLLTCRRS